MNVITKIAITTVPTNDCNELARSLPKSATIFRGCATTCGFTDTTGGLTGKAPAALADSAGSSVGSLGKGAGEVVETTGWFEESMNSTYPLPADYGLQACHPLSDARPETSATVLPHLAPHFSWSTLVRASHINLSCNPARTIALPP